MVEHFVYTERVIGSIPVSLKNSIYNMIKELYAFCFYFLTVILFLLSLSLNYASYFISFWCHFLEEGLVLHDSTEWVWAVWITTFFLSFCFILPYYFFLVYIWIKNLNTQLENLLFKILISLFFYCVFISSIIFVKDLFLSGFFLPSIKNISFEFQPGIESYLTFILGLFFDLLKSFILFQIFLGSIFFLKSLYLNIQNYIIILYLFTLILFFYWFGGEGFTSDFFLFLIILFLNQIILFSVLIFKHFRRYKIII